MSRERFLRHHPRLSYQNVIFSGEDKIIAEVTGQPPITVQEFVAFASGGFRGGERSNLTLCQSMRPFGRANTAVHHKIALITGSAARYAPHRVVL
jgi:hypothetical protein